MARLLRVEFEDAIYHLCVRGNARQRIFCDHRDRLRFLELLNQSHRRFDVAILYFVLKGNHVHLVAPNLSRWMHWLTVAYTVFFNRRHQMSGHLFQGRYKSFLREIGELFSGLDYAAVAQRIRRARSAHDAQTKRKLLKEILLNVET